VGVQGATPGATPRVREGHTGAARGGAQGHEGATRGARGEAAHRDGIAGQEAARGREERRERRGDVKRGGAHLGARRSAITVHRITPRAKQVEEREWELLHRKRK
jgi:hypothetical protein